MSTFANIKDGIVQNVIVADQEFIDSGGVGNSSTWKETWDEMLPENEKGSTKNFAGRGDTYDSVRDAFISPQPYPSWILSEETCKWNPPDPPGPTPNDGGENGWGYEWNEDTVSWDSRSEP